MTTDLRLNILYDIAVTAMDLIEDMRLTDFYQNELAQQRADAEQERRDRLAAAAQALGMQKQTLFANLAERGFTAGSQNQALAGALNQPGTALPGGDIGAISDMAQKAVAAAQASRGQSLALQLQ